VCDHHTKRLGEDAVRILCCDLDSGGVGQSSWSTWCVSTALEVIFKTLSACEKPRGRPSLCL
jgi:hypothetical protein